MTDARRSLFSLYTSYSSSSWQHPSFDSFLSLFGTLRTYPSDLEQFESKIQKKGKAESNSKRMTLRVVNMIPATLLGTWYGDLQDTRMTQTLLDWNYFIRKMYSYVKWTGSPGGALLVQIGSRIDHITVVALAVVF
jgi:hypothetical protein